MCIIIDANMFGDFLDKDNYDMQPVRDWMKKSGKLVYTLDGKFKRETDRSRKMKERIYAYRVQGKAKLIGDDAIDEQIRTLSRNNLRSDDEHIIALAKASNARLLVSRDQNLHADFTRLRPSGKVYQNKSHKHLLKRDLCP